MESGLSSTCACPNAEVVRAAAAARPAHSRSKAYAFRARERNRHKHAGLERDPAAEDDVGVRGCLTGANHELAVRKGLFEVFVVDAGGVVAK